MIVFGVDRSFAILVKTTKKGKDTADINIGNLDHCVKPGFVAALSIETFFP